MRGDAMEIFKMRAEALKWSFDDHAALSKSVTESIRSLCKKLHSKDHPCENFKTPDVWRSIFLHKCFAYAESETQRWPRVCLVYVQSVILMSQDVDHPEYTEELVRILEDLRKAAVAFLKKIQICVASIVEMLCTSVEGKPYARKECLRVCELLCSGLEDAVAFLTRGELRLRMFVHFILGRTPKFNEYRKIGSFVARRYKEITGDAPEKETRYYKEKVFKRNRYSVLDTDVICNVILEWKSKEV